MHSTSMPLIPKYLSNTLPRFLLVATQLSPPSLYIKSLFQTSHYLLRHVKPSSRQSPSQKFVTNQLSSLRQSRETKTKSNST